MIDLKEPELFDATSRFWEHLSAAGGQAKDKGPGWIFRSCPRKLLPARRGRLVAESPAPGPAGIDPGRRRPGSRMAQVRQQFAGGLVRGQRADHGGGVPGEPRRSAPASGAGEPPARESAAAAGTVGADDPDPPRRRGRRQDGHGHRSVLLGQGGGQPGPPQAHAGRPTDSRRAAHHQRLAAAAVEAALHPQRIPSRVQPHAAQGAARPATPPESGNKPVAPSAARSPHSSRSGTP